MTTVQKHGTFVADDILGSDDRWLLGFLHEWNGFHGVTCTVGTAGDDILLGTAGVDVLVAGPGNDLLMLSGTAVMMPGGVLPLTEPLYGVTDHDVAYGGDGDDRLISYLKAGDHLSGDAGNDVLIGRGGYLIGGDGNDVITCTGHEGALVWGGRGDDVYHMHMECDGSVQGLGYGYQSPLMFEASRVVIDMNRGSVGLNGHDVIDHFTHNDVLQFNDQAGSVHSVADLDRYFVVSGDTLHFKVEARNGSGGVDVVTATGHSLVTADFDHEVAVGLHSVTELAAHYHVDWQFI